MKSKVLIITHTKEENNCADTVTAALEKLDAHVVRLNVDQYPVKHMLASKYQNGRWEVLFDDGETVHCLNDFTAIWNRRFHNFGQCLHKVVDQAYLPGCITESRRAFFGMLAHLESEVFFMNAFTVANVADYKEAQLRIASELGMEVPQTCITNDPQAAKDFINSCPNGAISKLQHNLKTYEDGVEGTVFTNTVTADDVERLESLIYCPMQFQEKVEKKVELRIIVVGDQCYAFSIDSQVHEDGKEDWRKVGAQTLHEWVPCEVPQELRRQIVQYQRYFHMNYGAADFILTPDGKYVFLEVNPGGEFFWVDQLVDLAISDHIAKVLLGQAPRNPYQLHQLKAVTNS